jgi:transketolase N-terminal domain/subunit
MLLLKVDNLIATIDLNGKQIDGATDEVYQWVSELNLKL